MRGRAHERAWAPASARGGRSRSPAATCATARPQPRERRFSWILGASLARAGGPRTWPARYHARQGARAPGPRCAPRAGAAWTRGGVGRGRRTSKLRSGFPARARAVRCTARARVVLEWSMGGHQARRTFIIRSSRPPAARPQFARSSGRARRPEEARAACAPVVRRRRLAVLNRRRAGCGVDVRGRRRACAAGADEQRNAEQKRQERRGRRAPCAPKRLRSR